MAYKISWSKTAEKDFDNIISFIEKEFSELTASKFVNRTNEIFNILLLYPEAGSAEIKELNIRGFLINKNVKLFYRIKRNSIILLNFFDVRLDPEKKLKRYKKWKQ